MEPRRSSSGRVGHMTTESVHRNVTVGAPRTASSPLPTREAARSPSAAGETDFNPTELLLAAIGGCTAIDVDIVTSRRAEPEAFQVLVDADKVRDGAGNRLTDIEVTFRITFPGTAQGDQARAVLPDIVQKSHDRLCTVSRTVEMGTPIGPASSQGPLPLEPRPSPSAEKIVSPGCGSNQVTDNRREPLHA